MNRGIIIAAVAAVLATTVYGGTPEGAGVCVFDFRDTTLMKEFADKPDLKCSRGVLMDDVASHNRNSLNNVTFTRPLSQAGPELSLRFGPPTASRSDAQGVNKLKWYLREGNCFVLLSHDGISHTFTVAVSDPSYVITEVEMVVDDNINMFYAYNPRLTVVAEEAAWTWDDNELRLQAAAGSEKKSLEVELSRSQDTKPSNAGYDEGMGFSAIRVHYAPADGGSGSDGVTAVLTDGSESETYTYYDMQGVQVASPEHGIFIRRSATGAVTRMLVP